MEGSHKDGLPTSFDQASLVSSLSGTHVSLGPHSPWSPERHHGRSLSPPSDPEYELAIKRRGWKATNGAHPRGRDEEADDHGEANRQSRRNRTNGDQLRRRDEEADENGEAARQSRSNQTSRMHRRQMSWYRSDDLGSKRSSRTARFGSDVNIDSDEADDGQRVTGKRKGDDIGVQCNRDGRDGTSTKEAAKAGLVISMASRRLSLDGVGSSGGRNGKHQQWISDDTDEEHCHLGSHVRNRLRSKVVVPAADDGRRHRATKHEDAIGGVQRRRSPGGQCDGSSRQHRSSTRSGSRQRRGL